ncbi:hypothetical protein [Achromobacter marplatensis]|uniref:hypothetical protein n=1 Tax=Achromobacter marplatensis TaxID=470868 RepID=UPI0028EFBF9E|nr:hypothetical protein [Achromobacter marplatensis]
MLKNSEKMTRADWAILGLALILLVPPVLVITVLNKGDAAGFVTSQAGRAYFLSFASFWLAAMAGMTAGRGVVRHQRGIPKRELAVASIQDYMESGVLLVTSACTLALTALDEEQLHHRAFLWMLTAYPAIYAGYLYSLKRWEKLLRKRNKAVSLASAGLRKSRRTFLAVASVTALGLWALDWFYLPALTG